MSAGQFEVAQLDGNLDVTLTPGTGTTAGSTTNSIALANTTRLLDTSVDLSGNAWRLDTEGGANPYESLGTTSEANWKVKTLGSKNYYAAVSWTMAIKYTFASELGNMGVYLDLKLSAFSASAAADGAGGSNGDSAKGFRIMFLDTTNTGATVWGNHAAELEAAPTQFSSSSTYSTNDKVIHNNLVYKAKQAITAGDFDKTKWDQTFESTFDVQDSAINLQYVSAVDDTDDYKEEVTSGTLAKGNYFTSDSDYSRLSDGSGNTNKAERIATITKPAANSGNEATTSVTCIAWFEGTDPNVVNDTAMKAVSASMTFYARCDSTTSA